MEDKELKKKLAKIPDADENGDPIYKIDDEAKERVVETTTNRPTADNVPFLQRDSPSASQGNLQDEKDKTKE